MGCLLETAMKGLSRATVIKSCPHTSSVATRLVPTLLRYNTFLSEKKKKTTSEGMGGITAVFSCV